MNRVWRVCAAIGVVAVAGVLCASPAAAQKGLETYYAMQQMGADLGVACAHCHVVGPDQRPDYKAEGNPKKGIARKMMEMTAEINTRVWLATGGAPGDKAVTCVSCHRGVPVPLPIATVVKRAVEREGAEGAVAAYRSLRKQFYERDVYDFSEAELLRIARLYTDREPDVAIGLTRMNLEWRPASAVSYVVMAYAYTRKFDDRSAIPLLEKALELEPENGAARGYLHQLRQFQKGQ